MSFAFSCRESEKPLTLTIAEAKRVIDAVRKYKRVFQTGSQQRSSVFGPFRKAWEFLGNDEANTWRDRERRDPWQLPRI